MTTRTEAQRAALKWLRERGGEGVFGKRGVLLAAGEWAPFMRTTWNGLWDVGFIRIDGNRVRVTPGGFAFDCGKTNPRHEIAFLAGEPTP